MQSTGIPPRDAFHKMQNPTEQICAAHNARPMLDATDVRFVRRLARAINAECAPNGFYSGHGVTPEMQCGQRKFHGHVKVIAGRLMAREVGEDRYSVDLTGTDHVNGNGNGEVYASRRP